MSGTTVVPDFNLNGDLAPDEDPMAAWVPVDLAPIMAGDITTPTPDLLLIEHTEVGLFYRAAVNGLHGDSGIGKSWVALTATASELRAGRNVLYFDYEAEASEIVGRLLALMVPAERILAGLSYLSVNDPMSPTVVGHLVDLVTDRRVALVVIDSIGEAFAVDGINEDRDNEVGPWLRQVARRLAKAGPAVVLVDHSPKASDNPLHPSGSKRKRAAITGTSFLVTSTIPPTRDRSGRLYLTCAKDRHGTFRRGDTVAVLDIDPQPDGGVAAHVLAPSPTERGDAGIEVLMRAMVRAAKDEGASVDGTYKPLTLNMLIETAKVRARRETKIAAIDLAVARGHLTESAGPRNSRQLTFAREVVEAASP